MLAFPSINMDTTMSHSSDHVKLIEKDKPHHRASSPLPYGAGAKVLDNLDHLSGQKWIFYIEGIGSPVCGEVVNVSDEYITILKHKDSFPTSGGAVRTTHIARKFIRMLIDGNE
jgi:hypothetical protein